jgi:hypothetical protein
LTHQFVENLGGRLPVEFTGGKTVQWCHRQVDRRTLPNGILSLPYIQIRGIEEGKSGELTCIMIPYQQGA